MESAEQAHELARGWIEAWVRIDLDWLRAKLAEDFEHLSPFGRLAGRDTYLETVAPIARRNVHPLTIRNLFASGDHAVIWFDNETPLGAVPTCDWLTITDDRIAAVRSFFDTTLVREVLSSAELADLGGR